MATKREVEEFLGQFRLCIEYGSKARFRQTPKNIQGLAALNMTQTQATECVCRLRSENYCNGPEVDRDEDGKEVWVFGWIERGVEIYIKIRLDPNKPFSTPVIRSFHPAEHSLSYPLKGGGK